MLSVKVINSRKESNRYKNKTHLDVNSKYTNIYNRLTANNADIITVLLLY